jgi:hypothetical protein
MAEAGADFDDEDGFVDEEDFGDLDTDEGDED